MSSARGGRGQNVRGRGGAQGRRARPPAQYPNYQSPNTTLISQLPAGVPAVLPSPPSSSPAGAASQPSGSALSPSSSSPTGAASRLSNGAQNYLKSMFPLRKTTIVADFDAKEDMKLTDNQYLLCENVLSKFISIFKFSKKSKVLLLSGYPISLSPDLFGSMDVRGGRDELDSKEEFDVIICWEYLSTLRATEQLGEVRKIKNCLSKSGILYIRDFSLRGISDLVAAHLWAHGGSDLDVCCRTSDAWLTLTSMKESKWSRKPNGPLNIFNLSLEHPRPASTSSKSISASTPEGVKLLEDLGYTVRRSPHQNPHERAAIERTLMINTVVESLKRECAGKKDVVIGLLYDWGRLETFFRKYTDFDVRVWQVPEEALDYQRGDQRLDDLQGCDFLILHDQYVGMNKFNVAKFLTLCKPTVQVITILNPIFGLGGVKGKQAYLKVGDNVHCSPVKEDNSSNSAMYVHKSQDLPCWLLEPSTMVSGGFLNNQVWLERPSGRVAFRTSFSPVAVQSKLTVLTDCLREEVLPEVKRFLGFRYTSKRTVRIWSPVADKPLKSTPLNPWNERTTKSYVDSELAADGDWKSFSAAFPGHAKRIAHDTLLWVLFADKTEDFASLRSVADATQNADADRAEALGYGSVRRTWWSQYGPAVTKVGTVMAVGAVAGLAMYWYLNSRKSQKPPLVARVASGVDRWRTGLADRIRNPPDTRGVKDRFKDWWRGESKRTGLMREVFASAIEPPRRDKRHVYGGFVPSLPREEDYVTVCPGIRRLCLAAAGLGVAEYTRRMFLPSPWEQFRDAYNGQEYSVARTIHGSCEADRMALKSTDPWCPPKEQDKEHYLSIRVSGREVEELPFDERQHCVTVILGTNALLHQPTPGPKSMEVALRARQMQVVPLPTSEGKFRLWEAFEAISDEWPLFPLEPYLPEQIMEWADHYNATSKRREARRLAATLLEDRGPDWAYGRGLGWLGKYIHTRTSMHPKTNESLGTKEYLSLEGVKPRTIIAPHMLVQLHTQPWIARAYDRIQMILPELTLYWKGNSYRFTYASGVTSTELNEWALNALGFNGWSIIVCGDDSVVYNGANGDCYEIDYSHYDQSQRGIYALLDDAALLRLGVPDEVVKTLAGLAKASARFRHRKKDVEIVFKPSEACRRSGGPNTSLSNSINNMVALMVLTTIGFTKDSFAMLGLKAEMTRHRGLRGATFLRGTWYDDAGVPKWAYLPSMVIKIGKVGRAVRRDEFQILTYAMGRSLGNFREDFPILGPFCAKLKELGGSHPEEEIERVLLDEKPWFKHRPFVEIDISRSSVMDLIVQRYGITVEMVEEVEALIRAVPRVPWYIGHEVFTALRRDFE